MVSVQNWPFLNLSILGNIGRENVFYVIVEQNNNFLGYKNKKLKKAKNWHFSKAHGFGSKLTIFPPFYISNIGEENVFFWYSRTKQQLFRL